MKLSLVLFLTSAVSLASARWGHGMGGMEHGGGGHGGGQGGHGEMMDLIHDLIDNRKLIIRRTLMQGSNLIHTPRMNK